MEGEPQAPAAAAEATAPTESSGAPALPSRGGPASWEAAFVPEGDAPDRGDKADAEASAAPPSAPAASDKDAAPEDGAAPAAGPGDRTPQPGSRRGAAAEAAELKEQIKAAMADLEAERAKLAERLQADQRATAEVESFLGKPGELASLLSKEAEQGWLDHEENERKLALVRGTRLYQPLLEKARGEVRTEADQRVAAAESQVNGVLAALSAQLRTATSLPGVDASAIEKPDATLEVILKHVHAAGAASRDGEIADLKGQLDDARSRAFVSQPALATGGVSGSGRSESGYDPTRSPVSNLEEAFATPAPPASNGRR